MGRGRKGKERKILNRDKILDSFYHRFHSHINKIQLGIPKKMRRNKVDKGEYTRVGKAGRDERASEVGGVASRESPRESGYCSSYQGEEERGKQRVASRVTGRKHT